MMKIAYIISAYKYPEQLIRLITRLQTDSNSFFVHVDKKTPNEIYQQMVIGTQGLSNVFYLKRHRCNWGDFGHVRATLEGIRVIVQNNLLYDYAILLTGQDYPIKSNEQIMAFFQEHYGRSFMEHFPLPSDEWEGGGLERISHWHFYLNDHHYIFPQKGARQFLRKFPKQLQPFGGSSYWCLTKPCIDTIYQFIKDNPGFGIYFKHVDVPDEIFFHTILMNSPHATHISNDNLRYIEWRDPTSGSPAILGQEDFVKLAASPKLFARKFDLRVDSAVLDLIDQQLLFRVV